MIAVFLYYNNSKQKYEFDSIDEATNKWNELVDCYDNGTSRMRGNLPTVSLAMFQDDNLILYKQII